MGLGLHLIIVELTHACNLRCKHCYLSNFSSTSIAKDDFINIIVQSKDLGAWAYAFTGGEPLLLGERLFEYANLVVKLNPKAKIYLETNGTLLHLYPPKAFEVFNNVQVSLEEPKDINDFIRGKAFSKVLNNVFRLKAYGIEVIINITVNKININTLREFIEALLKEGLKVGIQFLTPTRPELKRLALSRREFARALKVAIKLGVKIDDPRRILFDKHLCEQALAKIRKKKGIVGGCTAGIATLAIDPSLNVYPCSRLRIKIGNLRKQTLDKIWLENDLLWLLRKRELKGKCGKCIFKYACGGCRGDAYAIYGDVLAEDPFCPYVLVEKGIC